MRELILRISGLVCEAQLCDAHHHVLAEARIALHGPTNWYELLAKVGDELKLSERPPPGLLVQGDLAGPWKAALAGFGIPGWGWGFYLPNLKETCSGFCDEAAATKGAQRLKAHAGGIPEFPNGTYEAFKSGAHWAFLDAEGEMHHGFPSPSAAQNCAAKLEDQRTENTASTS